MSTVIQFEVRVASVNAHLFHVTCTLTNAEGDLTFSLPSWTPGSYLVREFAQHIVSMKAFCNDAPLPISKVSKDSWRCKGAKGTLRLEYEVYAFDSSIRAAFIDDSYAFFSGTSVFVRLHGFETSMHTLTLHRAEARAHSRVATTMPKEITDEDGYGRYRCDDYDALVDYPVLMADFDTHAFEAGGVTHQLIVTPKLTFDAERLKRDCAKICEQHIALFRTPAPFKAYKFLLRVEEEGHGGLEHRDSSALLCKITDLPQKHLSVMSDGYRTLLGLISHEYFHAWNVKRLKPEPFLNYDFNNENYTELLWFFEGFTSYYDDLMLCRSQVISSASYLDLLAQTMTRVNTKTGRKKQSLAEASYDAWIKFYRPNENSGNATVSYYQKGSLIALALDLLIRRKTKGANSLDDVMRVLWKRYVKDASGITEKMIIETASAIGNEDLSWFFERYVHGTDDPDYAGLLGEMGTKLSFQPAALYHGCVVKKEGDFCKVLAVDEHSPAMDAGLCAGDALIAVNGLRILGGNLDAHLARFTKGESITITAFRRGWLRTFELTLGERHDAITILKPLPEPTPDQAQALKQWLGL